ncbi:LOW QUALITY PROTEIN: uncharacterized protein [Palaemon carinicauda]|uniref:LOW QUALITY PROTEIN: uncharacterized protein n=1 Tax=Palaemon carinicauda TaxID=392227 RepID=UPI0035B61FAA
MVKVLQLSAYLAQFLALCACACIPPAALPHGRVSLERGGIIVTYSCNPGHTLEGTAIAVCISGRWSTPSPKCLQDDVEEEDVPREVDSGQARKTSRRRSKKKNRKNKQRRPPSQRGESDAPREGGGEGDLPLEEQEQHDQHIISAYNIVESSSTIKDNLKEGRIKGVVKKNRWESSVEAVTGEVEEPIKTEVKKDAEVEEEEGEEQVKRKKERRRRRKDRRGKKRGRKGRKEERKRDKKGKRERRKKAQEVCCEPDTLANEVSPAAGVSEPKITSESADVGETTTPSEERKHKKGKSGRKGRGNKNRRNRNGQRRRRGKKGRKEALDIMSDGDTSVKIDVNEDNQIANEVVPSLHEVDRSQVEIPVRNGRKRKSKNKAVSSNEVEVPDSPPEVLPVPTTTTTTTSTTTTTTTTTTSTTPKPVTTSTAAVDTTEAVYVSTGYPQDSSYSAIEPQYTIEGREDERTIVDFVPESPSSALGDDLLKNTIQEDLKLLSETEEPKEARESGERKKKNKKKNRKKKKEPKQEPPVVTETTQVDWIDTYNELPEEYPLFSGEEKEPNVEGEEALPEGLPDGYPVNRFSDEVSENGKRRFIETDDINFATLDISCIISEIDSIYLPPPRVKNAHVTAYYTVTNPAPPNNVYVEAVYECKFGYRLTDTANNRVFCKGDKWLGFLPSCVHYAQQSTSEACGQDNGGCDQICETSSGSSQCSCYKGFRLKEDKSSCEDVDECEVNNGGCEGACFNKVGTHQCYCPRGYRLATNGKTCIDKNECLLRNGHGPCQDTCTNTEGGYICSCDSIPGTHLGADNHTCEDVDECAINNGGCSHICLNTFGQIFCTCPEGFIMAMDWKTCEDINECDHEEISSKCEHGCINTPGSYHCAEADEFVLAVECPPGLSPTEDNQSCQDVDECKNDNHGCSDICVNTHGNAHCSCPVGYTLGNDNKTCHDTDECSTDDGGCSHGCENSDGSYACTCPEGFTLSPSLKDCLDINECATESGGCQQICQNTEGSFFCDCEDGYNLDSEGHSCIDANECEKDNGGCDQICENEPGSFTCSCNIGYELEDDFHCSDIDECLLQLSDCEHDCKNLPGSYSCVCHDGFTLDADGYTCLDIDECGVDNGCSHFCTNQNGSYSCHCPPGWTLDSDGHLCKDIDECLEENGGCTHVCNNFDGGYKCQCPSGLILIEEGTAYEKLHVCVDIDECSDNNGNCSHECLNNEGDYECRCPEGFTFEKNIDGSLHLYNCIDINECVEDNGGCSHTCVNTEGGFRCECPKGLMLPELSSNMTFECEDVDECLKDNGGCSHVCVNLDGTYECECPDGWQLQIPDDYYDYYNEEDVTMFEISNDVVWKKCIDIDECGADNGGCSHICHNDNGSFQCSCPPGFWLSKDNLTCLDINECNVEKGGCSHECSNTEGSFRCLCPEGFNLVDDTRCLDEDECLKDNGGCSHKCINQIGSFHCACPEGLLLEKDNVSCSDLNECGDDNGGCSHECNNLHGRYTCSCPPGFILTEDEHTCEDFDECSNNNGNCSHHCINKKGFSKCKCPTGLILGVDGRTCLDVDECGMNNGGCSHQCSNREGHYTCLCPNGFKLAADNHTCKDVDECAHETGGCSYKCVNTEGGYECHCALGMTLGKDNHTCKDVDECAKNNGGCSGECHNMQGSFRCECPIGYRLGSDGITCEDIDECVLANAGCSHSCTNTQGSFICKCPTGYKLAEDLYRCLDIDECEKSPCEHECVNTLGSFYCSCKSGYKPRPDAAHSCWDVNECDEGNAGCAQDCYNTVGSYHCGCSRSFVLGDDAHSCEAKPVFCPVIVAPLNGDMVCTQDLEGGAYPMGTTCMFSCAKGAALHGSANTTCLSTGSWSRNSATCQAVKCSVLAEVNRGRVSPSRCVRRTSNVGQHCYLSCSPGYRVVGNPVRTCRSTGSWSPEAPSPYCEKDTLKPFIQCPSDVTVELAPHQSTSYVRLPQPKANVDWYRYVSRGPLRRKLAVDAEDQRYVEANPGWAKQLEADLPSGKTTVTFVARSPVSDESASCTFIVEVVDKEDPQVFGCPKSFTVHLADGEASTEVMWKEPVFKDNVEIAHLWKSMEPGQRLTVGTYPVHYVAMDPYRNRAKCSFTISITSPWVFSKLAIVVTKFLQLQGVQVIAYLNELANAVTKFLQLQRAQVIAYQDDFLQRPLDDYAFIEMRQNPLSTFPKSLRKESNPLHSQELHLVFFLQRADESHQVYLLSLQRGVSFKPPDFVAPTSREVPSREGSVPLSLQTSGLPQCDSVHLVQSDTLRHRMDLQYELLLIDPQHCTRSPNETWRVPPGCTVVRTSTNAYPAHWGHTLTNTQVSSANNAVMGARHQAQAQTPPPSVYTPLSAPQQQSPHRSQESKYGKLGKRFRGRNPVRGDMTSSSYRDRMHSSAASQLLQTFQQAALQSGQTLAIAHAHARGGPNTHAQALAHAGVYNFG